MRAAVFSSAAAALLALTAPTFAAASGADVPRLTLADALQRAATRNPALDSARARYLAMRERPRIEGSLPDPTVGVRYHNEDWGLSFGESEFSFVEIGAEQELPFPGKRSLRERIAVREAERERAMRDATAAMVLAAVAARHAELAVAERSAEILSESRELIELMVKQVGAKIYYIDAVEHDAYVAGVSHLPFMLSAALVELVGGSAGWKGGSFRSWRSSP